MRFHLFLFGLGMISTAFAAPLFPSEPEVRVQLINALDTLNIRMDDPWQIELLAPQRDTLEVSDSLLVIRGAGTLLLQLGQQPALACEALRLIPPTEASTLSIQQVPFGVGWWWGGREDRIYEADCTSIWMPKTACAPPCSSQWKPT